jgi:transposase
MSKVINGGIWMSKAMMREEDEEINLRIKMMWWYNQGQKSIKEICEELGRSRTYFYYWKKRFEKLGYRGLLNRSKAPKMIANKLSEDIETKIVELRTQGANANRMRSRRIAYLRGCR